MGRYKKTSIKPSTVVWIHKKMLKKPIKVWLKLEFSNAYPKKKWELENHMKLLIDLGLIEIVPARYYCGNKMRTRRDVKGYKLIAEKKDKTNQKEVDNK